LSLHTESQPSEKHKMYLLCVPCSQ
jgi:hypothetical protein